MFSQNLHLYWIFNIFGTAFGNFAVCVPPEIVAGVAPVLLSATLQFASRQRSLPGSRQYCFRQLCSLRPVRDRYRGRAGTAFGNFAVCVPSEDVAGVAPVLLSATLQFASRQRSLPGPRQDASCKVAENHLM